MKLNLQGALFQWLLVVLPSISTAWFIVRPVGMSVLRSQPSCAFKPRLLEKFSSVDDMSEAEQLRQQAEYLRIEIAAFEQGKLAVEQSERRKSEEERMEQDAIRSRYSAIVPILKPDGSVMLETCEFPPRHKDGRSFITTIESSLPLGVLLGEGEGDFTGLVFVDEVASGSNGEQGGLLEGDIVRALTACKMGMDMPTWQVIAGGIGIPKTRRFMYAVDRMPFDEVMDAVSSNRMDPEQRPVVIVIERRNRPT